MTTFTERLRAAFDRKGCTRADLAAKLRSTKGTMGISATAIGEALNGGSKSLSAENAALAARFLGVDVFWLCTGEGSMVPERSPQPQLTERDSQLLRDLADMPPSKITPLCAGGPDNRDNMQWQTVAEAKLKDRAERAQCRRR